MGYKVESQLQEARERWETVKSPKGFGADFKKALSNATFLI